MTDTTAGEGVEAIVRRWANWIIDESADRDDVSDHDAGKRKVRAERDAILKALAAQPSAGAQGEAVARIERGHPSGSLFYTDFGQLADLPSGTLLYATPAQPDTGDVAALREASWEWWASRDEENYLVGPCDTREQAVEQALEDFDGEPFHVVEACKGSMAQYLPSGERVIEWMTEYADDNGAFGEDQYCELTGTKEAIESAEADAAETLKAWYARHAAIFPTPWAFHKTRNGEWVTLKAALSKPNAPGAR